MPDAKDALLKVLRDSRDLLARPDNDFNWSSWHDVTDAVSDLDGFIIAIEAGNTFEGPALSVLFAPTGDIQEVSMSSGWGTEYLSVAERFDSAFAKYQATRNT